MNPLKRLDPRLLADLKAQSRPIIFGLLCTLVTSLLTTGTIVLMRQAVSILEGLSHTGPTSLIANPTSWWSLALGGLWGIHEVMLADIVPPTMIERLQPLWLASLAVVLLYGVKYWFTRGQTYFLSYAANRLAADLRIRLHRKLQRLPVSFFGGKRQGALQSVLSNDVNVYQNAVSIIRDSIDGPVKAIGAFGTILAINWQLAGVAFLLVPVMVLAIQRNARKMRAAQTQVQNDLASVFATTHESLAGIRIVKAFGAEERMSDRYIGVVDQSFASQMRATRVLASLRPLVELIGACAVAGFFSLSGWLALQGRLSIADVTAMVFALDVINQGFRSIGNVNNTIAQVQAASEHIYTEILDVPEHHVDEPGAQTIDHPTGRFEFRNVSFAYPDGTKALDNVSFVIEPGKSLALVGPSGAGKSTIADLMLRFYDPTEGQIFLDGIDLRDLKISWLRAQFGVVPQHIFLFAGTLADNLRLGAPDATDADVEAAGQAAHVDVFANNLPHRYETTIGELGQGLSGGERQRVAIARALIRKPTILLLDEATSALDATSEKAVQSALEEIMAERTTLFIAHRLTTAARADRILVLRRGEAVEIGTHQELMERNGTYAGLFRAFSDGVLGVGELDSQL
ncbi:MAG: ABC transporter ATP-binding protein [Fimbriimonas sp.]